MRKRGRLSMQRNDITSKEEALQRIDELPKIIFSRLKGKLLSDIEQIVGEKLIDMAGNDVISNGRAVYKTTPLLQSLRGIVQARADMLSADLKSEMDKIKKYV